MLVDKKNIINIVIIVFSIIIAYLAFTGFNCLYSSEKFTNSKIDLGNFKNDDFSYSDISKVYFNTKDNDFLFNGMVFKQYYNNAFYYLYKFNLPIPQGGDYNKIDGKYTVLAGLSKDDLKIIGFLERSSDGWFYLQSATKEEYKYTQIVFSNSADNSKNIIIFQKAI